jgi:hypothetical protein
MNNIQRLMTSLLLMGIFVMPITPAVVAAAQISVQFKAYDRRHKDYHDWNDDENRRWSEYRTQNHMKPRDYRRAHRGEQDKYWEYRHNQENEHRR